jgi:hypothetical protein
MDDSIKPVLKQTELHGSQAGELQIVGYVYMRGKEYRIYALSQAIGRSLEWVKHFSVHAQSDAYGEVIVNDAQSVLAIKLIKEELDLVEKRTANRVQGHHPDGQHHDAQICRQGHVQHCQGTIFESETYCQKCGAPCIEECQYCREPILGMLLKTKWIYYEAPSYCHGCGHPYPWMEERLNTARELLDHDDQLTEGDRKLLWNDLQYVMSDPKADLVPAKKKLINIKLNKASAVVREAVLDLVAKIAVESVKS